MQKRFCSCGHMVFVRYQCNNGKWRPMVVVQERAGKKEVRAACPSCGNRLSINTLR